MGSRSRYGPIVSGAIALEDHNRVADRDAIEGLELDPAGRLPVDARAEAAAEVDQPVGAVRPFDAHMLLAGAGVGQAERAGARAADGDRLLAQGERLAALLAFENVEARGRRGGLLAGLGRRAAGARGDLHGADRVRHHDPRLVQLLPDAGAQ